MKETKVICPNCGAEIKIADKTHAAAGIVIGKDAGLGTVMLELADASAPAKGSKAQKANERIQALKAAGVDTSSMFAIQSGSGEGMICRIVDGIPTPVADDDPIFQKILQGKTIPNRRLFRRWIMSQTFHMLCEKDYYTKRILTFHEALKRKGFEYQFKMLQDELDVQNKLSRNDFENYHMRQYWFNNKVVYHICLEYIDLLKNYIEKLTVRHCKGIPYKRFHGRVMFVSDLDAKLYMPLYNLACKMKLCTNNPSKLAALFREFNQTRVRLSWDTPMMKSWVNAYKGAGGYFTLRNMIMFHGCSLALSNKTVKTQAAALKALDEYAETECKDDGYKMIGLLTSTLSANHIDVEQMIASWRK